MTRRDPEPRLLTQTQAAAYCGMCATNFKKACPVKPVNLLARIPRYDRHAIDAWIDGLTKSPAEEDWLGRLFANDRNGDARARNKTLPPPYNGDHVHVSSRQREADQG